MVAESKNPLRTFLTNVWRKLVKESCLLWPEFRAEICRLPDDILHVDSPRTGGTYAIGGADVEELWRLDNHARARLTTWLVNERRSGVSRPVITSEEIGLALESQPLPITQRADRLLGYIKMRIKMYNARPAPRPSFLSSPSRNRSLRTHTLNISLRSGRPLAWSESVDYQDIKNLFDYLQEQGWVTGEISPERDRDGRAIRETEAIRCTVTVAGTHRLEDLNPNANSKQAFVAMWLSNDTSAVFEKGIVPGVKAAGYEPYRVDKDPGVDKIDTAIWSEIRRSRFLVADVTHDEKGHRASVYYEIGVAHDMGIPVIFTCRKDCMDELPFDTQQYKHYEWETGKEGALIGSLRAAITERVGPPTLRG